MLVNNSKCIIIIYYQSHHIQVLCCSELNDEINDIDASIGRRGIGIKGGRGFTSFTMIDVLCIGGVIVPTWFLLPIYMMLFIIV